MSRPFVVTTMLLLVAGAAVAALPATPTVSMPSDPIPGASSTDPALVGAWGTPFEGQSTAISMVLLKDGRVLYWGGVEAGDHDHVFFFEYPHESDSAILAPPYDAASVTIIDQPADMRDLFCAGQTILADGRVLTAGGSEWKQLGEDNTGFVDGIPDAWTFDPATSQWVRESDMANGRWYPTVMTLADGNALAASGITHLPQAHTLNPSFERFDGASWTDIEADNYLPMYPRLFTVPSGPMKGDIFFATVGTLWGPFGEHPTEPLWNLEQVLDKETNTWSYLGPSVFGSRQHAATVMLPLDPANGYKAELLTFGGSLDRSLLATAASEITDISTNPPTHRTTEPLAHPRWHTNGVILPDGSVLAIGGGLYDNVYAHGQPDIPVLTAERFDPATETWTDLAAMSVARMYHSTALLLPDGRVLVGGHVPLPVPWKAARDNVPTQAQIAETRFEIYSPPYLSWGARPTITSAPASVGYGDAFTVFTPDAANIHDAILVHPGATTHAWDANERAIILPVDSWGTGTVNFVAPPDGDVAMPGPWMLFLRTSTPNGLVPSVATFVDIS